ncbi:C3a anaphylatoxin chemotactic receptor, partial [Silurus asotus]
TTNTSEFMEESWSSVEKSVLVVILSIEIVLGILGNGLILIVKMVCRNQYQCVYWLPFVSLTLSDLCCAMLIMTGSLLAVLTGGQSSPWCEVVSLFKFTFITSSIGSIAILCVQQYTGLASTRRCFSVIIILACSATWLLGAVFGVVPVIYDWVRFDPAEMLCAVFWESSYSDMMIYILSSLAVTIFPSLLLIIACSFLTWAGYGKNCASQTDLSSVTSLLVGTYLFCYTPFAVSELILLGRMDLSPSPEWLRTFSAIMAYLDCSLNPIIYCTNQEFREAVLAIFWTSRKSTIPEPVLTSITKID